MQTSTKAGNKRYEVSGSLIYSWNVQAVKKIDEMEADNMKRTPIRKEMRLTGIWRLEQRSRGIVEGAGVGTVTVFIRWVQR
jgi:hypothetical protein